MKLFVEGRQQTFSILEQSISKNDNVIWIHAASLGEFEQGLPVIEKIKKEKPTHKILITFFSPSGYEVKKNTPVADVVVYLPFDTRNNVKKFIALAHPELAIFVKYEIWPNYLKAIKSNKIPALLISAFFRATQPYFKWYGSFMRRALKRFSHIFLQDEKSKKLLASIAINNVTVNGDTRLDRVSEILEQNNQLPLIEAFKQDGRCLVAGSTWKEDHDVLLNYINTTTKKLKFIIAPHKIEKDKILELAASISKKTVLFSACNLKTANTFDVLIIDNIGMLTKIYSYADIAYVGGGFSTGLHNTMEPAVFGIPVIIGPNYKGFKEAEELVSKKGIISITDRQSFADTLNRFLDNQNLLLETGKINETYIAKNKGASIQIMKYLHKLS